MVKVFFRTLALMMILVMMSLTTSCAQASSGHDSALPTIIANETIAFTTTDADGDTITYCAGVWVSETKILTAAHCALAMAEKTTHIDDLLRIRAALGAVDAIREIRKILAEATSTIEYSYIIKDEYTGLYNAPLNVHLAKVQKIDEQHDLALLEASDPPLPHAIAPIAEDQPRVGDRLEFMGHPGAIAWTYVTGIVAAYREEHFRMFSSILGPFMQVSAPIFLGNSGGGAFDERGRLVGICSFISSQVPDVGFYVQLSTIRSFLELEG